jgi:hypothetical protein
MSYEKRPGTFTLFPNKDRKTDKHPNTSGTLIDDEGNEWFIDGWTRTSGNGAKFISGTIKRKQPRDAVERVKQGVEKHFGGRDELEDPLPF